MDILNMARYYRLFYINFIITYHWYTFCLYIALLAHCVLGQTTPMVSSIKVYWERVNARHCAKTRDVKSAKLYPIPNNLMHFTEVREIIFHFTSDCFWPGTQIVVMHGVCSLAKIFMQSFIFNARFFIFNKVFQKIALTLLKYFMLGGLQGNSKTRNLTKQTQVTPKPKQHSFHFQDGVCYPIDHSPIKFLYLFFLYLFCLDSKPEVSGFKNRLIVYLQNILHWFPIFPPLQGDVVEVRVE